MNLTVRRAPHIRISETNRTLMVDMIISLVPLYIMAYLYYGIRALYLGVWGILVAVAADCAGVLLRREKLNVRDLSSVVTGMMVPLLLPASISYTTVAVAVLFGILVAKQPFGGVGQNIFNPTAAGIAFVTLSWPNQVLRYPTPLAELELFGDVTAQLSESPAYALKMGGVPIIDPIDMLLGNFKGPMGATYILVIAACLLYLLVRRTVRWNVAIPFLGVVAVMALLFPRANLTWAESIAYEMFSGSLFFGAVFLINDPVTSPKHRQAQILYGVLAGVLTMLYRYFGGLEQGVVFAILIVNALSATLDKFSEVLPDLITWIRRKHGEGQSQDRSQPEKTL